MSWSASAISASLPERQLAATRYSEVLKAYARDSKACSSPRCALRVSLFIVRMSEESIVM